MTFEFILISLCCFLLVVVSYLAHKLYKFSVILIDLEDAIEKSLDILDTKYSNMSEILEKPVFFDSVEVRQVLAEIADSQRAVLIVANILTQNARMESESESEKENI